MKGTSLKLNSQSFKRKPGILRKIQFVLIHCDGPETPEIILVTSITSKLLEATLV